MPIAGLRQRHIIDIGNPRAQFHAIIRIFREAPVRRENYPVSRPTETTTDRRIVAQTGNREIAFHGISVHGFAECHFNVGIARYALLVRQRCSGSHCWRDTQGCEIPVFFTGQWQIVFILDASRHCHRIYRVFHQIHFWSKHQQIPVNQIIPRDGITTVIRDDHRVFIHRRGIDRFAELHLNLGAQRHTSACG